MRKDLGTSQAQVEYLMDSVDGVRANKVLLTLLYWKVFDGIDIPAELTQEILKKATNPESIFRYTRHLNPNRKAKSQVR